MVYHIKYIKLIQIKLTKINESTGLLKILIYYIYKLYHCTNSTSRKLVHRFKKIINIFDKFMIQFSI